jgi:predicted PurR-regulated permease PerM
MTEPGSTAIAEFGHWRGTPEGGDRGPNTSSIELRTFALVGLFTVAMLFAVKSARPLLLPVMLAALNAVVLAPIVSGLERVRLPRAIGAGVVVLALLGSMITIGYQVADPASSWIESAPRRIAEVESSLSFIRTPMKKMSQAAERVEERVGEITGAEQNDARTVVVRSQSLSEAAINRGGHIIAGLIVMLALLYFLLASGDHLMRQTAGLAREAGAEKLSIARNVRRKLSGYLLTVVTINALLGLAVGIALHLIGMPNALLWGLVVMFLNFVPYLGGIAGLCILGVAALTSIDDPSRALMAPAAYAVLNGIEGMVITPLVLGRRMRLNPVAVFLSILLWSWLWGIPGALLAVPVLAAMKVIAEAYPALAPMDRLLAR